MDRKLDKIILEKAKDFKTDKLTMSLGGIMNLYEDDEIKINFDSNRTFCWDKKKQTNFIESILLGIPISPIFVAEAEDGTWEIIDGVQRIATVLAFFGLLENIADEKNNFVLGKAKIIPELEGLSVEDLNFKVKFIIKRATVLFEVINRDSNEQIKNEIFQRVNATKNE